jgi:hypothetical protein
MSPYENNRPRNNLTSEEEHETGNALLSESGGSHPRDKGQTGWKLARESQWGYAIQRSSKKSFEVVETDPDSVSLSQAGRRGRRDPQGLHSTARKFNFGIFHRVYTQGLQSQ